MKNVISTLLSAMLLVVIPTIGHASTATETTASASDDKSGFVWGLQILAGGRFDNVRMCVATPAGVKGGPAMDITVFAEIPIKRAISLGIHLPVFRPVMFGAAFKMLQFEPEVSLLIRAKQGIKTDLIVGPTLGITLHYGPDYTSAGSGDNRGPAFFALGPRIGAYLGIDFKRPKRTFNFQLGFEPYVSPLIGVNDPNEHVGVVAGVMLIGGLRFS